MSLTLTGQPPAGGAPGLTVHLGAQPSTSHRSLGFKGYTGIVAQVHHHILTKRTCENDTWETGTMANHLPKASQ